jgi:hypothetical protein
LNLRSSDEHQTGKDVKKLQLCTARSVMLGSVQGSVLKFTTQKQIL